MRLPKLKEQSTNPPGSAHVALQTSATVVGALATVFALVLAQAKDNPKIVWTLVVVAALSLLAIIEPFVRRLIAFIQTRRVRRTRDKAARTEHAELMALSRNS